MVILVGGILIFLFGLVVWLTLLNQLNRVASTLDKIEWRLRLATWNDNSISNTGREWTCPKCNTRNSITRGSCKNCKSDLLWAEMVSILKKGKPESAEIESDA